VAVTNIQNCARDTENVAVTILTIFETVPVTFLEVPVTFLFRKIFCDAHKSRFFDFFEVVLELFTNCLLKVDK